VKRPTPWGLAIGVALAIPVLIEARTLLVWLGYDVPLDVYAPVAIAVVGLLALAIWTFGEEGGGREGNPSRA